MRNRTNAKRYSTTQKNLAKCLNSSLLYLNLPYTFEYTLVYERTLLLTSARASDISVHKVGEKKERQ